jgi:hypothetical protein
LLYCLSHALSPFFFGYFGDRVSQIICPGCHQTASIVLFWWGYFKSATWRISGV